MGGFSEILRLRRGNVDKGLRVTIHQGKPAALNVDHDAMTAAKGVEDVWNVELDGGDFPRFERLGLLEAFSKFPAENIAAHQLLVAPHREISRIWFWVGKVACVNIDQFDHPIGIGAG